MIASRIPTITMLLGSMFLAACAGSAEPSDTLETTSAALEVGSEPLEAEATARVTATSARIVELTATARVLELLDARGRILARYYPGFFSATQLVPDVVGNTGEEIAQRNRGTYFLATTINPRTGVVAVAVRSFIYAETSFDAVYRLDTRGAAFAASPYGAGVASLLPFDGRAADGTLPTANDVTRPFISIDFGGLAYDAAGRLRVRTADASGGIGTIVYNPNGSVASCTFVGGEGRRCPTGF